MSIRRLPRQMGLVVICNGTSLSRDTSNCTRGENGKPMKFVTGVIRADYTRAWLKEHAEWGRGLRLDHKRNDLCPYCHKLERFLVYQLQWRRAEDKAKSDEAKKAQWTAEGVSPAQIAARLAPKPRKKKGEPAIKDIGETTSYLQSPSSPSAASAPAAPT